MRKLAEDQEEEIITFIAGRIRLRRIELGLSQKALAKMLNITFQQVQKYETARDRVYSHRLFIIAKHLRVDPSYFYPNKTSERHNYDNGALATRSNLEAMKGMSSVTPPIRDAICKLLYSLSAEPPARINPKTERLLQIQRQYKGS